MNLQKEIVEKVEQLMGLCNEFELNLRKAREMARNLWKQLSGAY